MPDQPIRDYLTAGFSRKLGFGLRPALLMVDFIDAYFIKTSPLYAKVERVAKVAARVLAAGRSSRVPIVFTKVVYDDAGLNGGVFVRKIAALASLKEGTRQIRFAKGLQPRAGELVITKQYASAFFGTSLASTLTAAGVDSVLICGLTTSGCVRASAVDAMQYGFIPTVIADAVGDRDPYPHEANLFDLRMKYADVVDSNAAIEYLRDLKPTRERRKS
jgi:maleamate amidohydrolase